jgi:hypothetical protein
MCGEVWVGGVFRCIETQRSNLPLNGAFPGERKLLHSLENARSY